VITDTQSYSLVIRDIFFDAVSQIPIFANFTKRKCKQFSVQANQIPFLGVYIIDEQMAPDGDINAGHIRFISNLRIGFSAVIKNNDPVVSEAKLDEMFWAIMNKLWPDQYIMNMLDTMAYGHPGYLNNPDNVRVEGISRGMRRHNWGNSQLNNEIPLAELQYDVTAVYRMGFPPIITDDLESIGVQVVPMRHDGTVPPAEEVERVIAEYDLTSQ
jgi:hypothetical protein